MGLYKRLDEIIEAVSKIPELIEALRKVKRELGGLRKSLTEVEKRVYNMALDLKEHRLLGPDAYPEEVKPREAQPFPPYPGEPLRPIVPKQSFYPGRSYADGTTFTTSPSEVENPSESSTVTYHELPPKI